ncbi:hypothetical protein G6F35_017175 [Rhizopus arrhizus]|nr:hypothetical protein G6F35_017175 [Rhizopus arrhizus]
MPGRRRPRRAPACLAGGAALAGRNGRPSPRRGRARYGPAPSRGAPAGRGHAATSRGGCGAPTVAREPRMAANSAPGRPDPPCGVAQSAPPPARPGCGPAGSADGPGPGSRRAAGRRRR